MDEVDRLLASVKQATHGMLSLAVYRSLYDSAAASGGGTIVEIGTAQGAATIALALGAQSGGQDFRIVSVDGFVIGSRPRAASIEEKAAIVRRGFEAFGVSDRIDLIVGQTADMIRIVDPRDVALLLLDADGRIDRDLALLHERLRADCAIVIDDIEDRNFLQLQGRRLRIRQKHRLTHMLVRTFVESGLLVPDGRDGLTRWYRKGPASLDPAGIERLALPCYRELVVAEVDARELRPKSALYDFAALRAPWLVRAWRRLRPERSKPR